MADERATARPYTALMKFVQCVRSGGHTWPTPYAHPGGDMPSPSGSAYVPPFVVAVDKCSVCGAIKNDKNLLQLIAEAKHHTPDAYARWTCPCGAPANGAVCSKCAALKPTGFSGAGCG